MLKLRKTLGLHLWASLGAALLLFVLWAPAALAEGTETLGPPGIAIAAGSDVIAAGTGLNLAGQPQGEGTIVFDVPADATVNQVLLYWEGQAEDAGATPVSDTAVVDGVPVVGTLIGGPLFFASPADNALQGKFVFQHEWYDSAYRADITGLGLVGPGANSLFIDIELGPDTRVINGAGVLVVIETPGPASDIQLRDGIDMAFFDVGTGFAPPPRNTTVKQTFSFAPSLSDRTASLDLFFSSVAGQISGQDADRPSSIEVTVGGTTQTFSDLLGSVDGDEWDTVVLPITIPAGAEELSVQAFSRDDLGTGKLVASFLWVAAALSIEEEEEVPPEGCRWTGGLNDTFDTGDGVNRYTGGGQAGANTALPPQPKGEWTHTQQEGPAGAFTFHGGTASAPEGTEIDEIRCSDPDTCKPSGDPPSPLKQLDFDGIGTFKNIGDNRDRVPDFVLAGANVTAEGHGNQDFDGTFHWFEVNIDDDGEPGNSNPNKNPDDVDPGLCPPNGFGEKGDQALANCGCSDFYRITIYDGVNAADVVKNPDGSIDPSMLNRTDVIYQVQGYIDGGNLQIHRLTGFDLKQTQ